MKPSLFALAALLLPPPLWAADFVALDKAAARRLADPASHRQPTVVALWSSDCIHCKKNLRLFSAMAKKDRHLRIVSIATETESPELTGLLDALPLPGKRYAYGDTAPEALAYALDPTWRGELPRTLIFDGKGGKTAVSGALDQAAVRQALLAASAK